MIYNDKKLQIGCISKLVVIKKETKLKLSLYLSNLCKEEISNLNLAFQADSNLTIYFSYFEKGIRYLFYVKPFQILYK